MPIALLLIISVALTWPVLASGNGWGLYDWDVQLFYLAAPWRSVVEFGQFPGWNPWQCGGNPLHANPHSPVLSLTFLLTLLFGVPFGAKVAVAVHAFLGMAGAYVFARALGLDRAAATLAGVLTMGSTVYGLHVAAGHLIWLAMAYVPWALYAYVRSRDDLRWALGVGMALTAIALHGHLYLVVYTSVALGIWAVLDAVVDRGTRGLATTLVAGATFAVLSAVKTLPMLTFVGDNDFRIASDVGGSWQLFVAALLSRDQSMQRLPQLVGQSAGWWEYGAYIGMLPLVLVIVGSLSGRRGMGRAALLAAIFLVLASGSFFGVYPVLARVPPFSHLRVPSRFVLMTMVFLAPLAGAGLERLRAEVARRMGPEAARVLALVVIGFVAADLVAVNRRPLQQSLIVAPQPHRPPGPFAQVLGGQRYLNRTTYPTMYPHLLENSGVVNCYERLHLPVQAVPRSEIDGTPVAAYRGEAHLLDRGSAEVVRFSPNRMEVEYRAEQPTRLVLNQNFDQGWESAAGPVVPHEGLVAVDVPAGARSVVFQYRPRFLTLGAVVSAGGWLAAAFGCVLGRRRP